MEEIRVSTWLRPVDADTAGKRGLSECRRRVDPDENGLAVEHVAPGMDALAVEIETVARMEIEEPVAIKDDFEPSREHVNELLAVVLIRAFARSPGCQMKPVTLYLVTPLRQQLYGDPGWRRRQSGPLPCPHKRFSGFGRRGVTEGGNRRAQRPRNR